MWEREFKHYVEVLAVNIKAIRLQKGIAQERLALDAGVDRTVVSKIERLIGNPSLEILVKIAVALDVTVIDLLNEKSLDSLSKRTKSSV